MDSFSKISRIRILTRKTRNYAIRLCHDIQSYCRRESDIRHVYIYIYVCVKRFDFVTFNFNFFLFSKLNSCIYVYIERESREFGVYILKIINLLIFQSYGYITV